MPVNKTLYVKDDDAPIWDKAREFAGDKLSAQVIAYLKQFVAHKEAIAQGFKRIVLTYREKGKLPRSKAFYGRWLVPPDDPWCGSQPGGPDWYALAITAKNKVAIFNFYNSRQDERGIFPWATFAVFNSLDEATECAEIPSELIAEAMERLGIEVEELEI